MIDAILLILGAALVAFWDIVHMFPAKGGVRIVGSRGLRFVLESFLY